MDSNKVLPKQRDQLASHEEQVMKLENALTEHKQGTVPTKGLALQNYREKEAYLQYEVYNPVRYFRGIHLLTLDNFHFS